MMECLSNGAMGSNTPKFQYSYIWIMTEFIINSSKEFWLTLCEMSPYLLFGFLAAGVLSVLVSPKIIENHLGGKGIWPVVKASVFGVPLPLCSCSVIPVTVSLKNHGASKGAATAFLISTPQTGVDSILVTYGLLGPVFAIFRPVVAFLTGLIGGFLVDNLEEPVIEKKEKSSDDCCSRSASQNKLYRIFHYGFVTLPKDISKPLIIGLVIAGVLAAVVPDDFFSQKINSDFLVMLIMLVLGIPMYVCSTASVPIAAVMISKGISPGAALVFLITGAATNAAGIATIWKLLGKKTACIYLITIAVSAVLSGFILNLIYSTFESTSGKMHHSFFHLPYHVKAFFAILLLFILAANIISGIIKNRSNGGTSSPMS